MKYLYWALLWIPLLLVSVFGRIASPAVCLFIERKPRMFDVIRLNSQPIALPRDSLVWWLTWFDTDDNPTDEYWYGCYDDTGKKTQEYYDTHTVYRWYCRVRWLNRNSMYTFNRKFFGMSKDSSLAWQYKAHLPLWFGYYNNMNIGFKAHRGFDRLMYAGRVLGLRKYSKT